MNIAYSATVIEPQNINTKESDIGKDIICLEGSKDGKLTEEDETENMHSDENIFKERNNISMANETGLSVDVERIEAKTTSGDTDNEHCPNNQTNEELKCFAANSLENGTDPPVKKIRTRLQSLIDSDTSDDDASYIRNEICEEAYTSESGYRKIEDSPDKEKTDYSFVKSRLKALCDSESSEDERETTSVENDDVSMEKENMSSKLMSKSKKLEKAMDKKMTAKEYEEQKLQIKSESQRMERERNVSLPYHRPKSRSIKEFLEKRPRFTAAFSANVGKTPAILAIKMTNQNLERISKKLEQREKMLQVFYKSESESEEEIVDSKDIDADNKLQDNINQQITELYQKHNKNESNVNNNIPQENTINLTENENNNATEEIQANPNEKSLINATTKTSIEIISNIIIPEENTAENLLNNESVDYEFSLDNADLTEILIEESNIPEESASPHGNDTESVISKNKFNRLQMLKEALGNSIPKLSGDPNKVINLDEDMVPVVRSSSSGVDKLIERFIEHAKKTVGPKKDSVQVDVLSVSDGELRKEVFTMAVHSNDTDEHVAVMETPGAKLKKLRNELQSQMALRRSEMWKKQKNVLVNVASVNGDSIHRSKEGYEDGSEYDVLDDEEEEEFDVEEEEDEDLVEDDVDMSDKKKGTKSAFIEEEAELSETENAAAPNEIDDDEDEDDDDDDDNDNVEEEPETESKEIDTDLSQISAKKKLKRIILMDDSDDETENNKSHVVSPKDIPTSKGALDSTDPWEDDDSDSQLLCPNAQRPPSRQRTPQLTDTKSSATLGFITPVRQLTALQSLQSFDSSPPNEDDGRPRTVPIESPVIVPLTTTPDPSPLRGNAWQRHLLFPEGDAGGGASTINMEELANEICSGKFPSSLSQDATNNGYDDSNFIKPSFNNAVSSQQTQPSTQDVLDICSGNFTQNISSKEISDASQISLNSCPSSTNNVTTNINIVTAQNENISSRKEVFKLPTSELLDDDDDKIISQLLDEEEMEKFRKKFESPINETEKVEIPPSSPVCGRIMFDSSTSEGDDDVNDDTKRKVKVLRKKRKKTCLIEESDDEELECKAEENEGSGFENENGRFEYDETQDSEGNVVGYDSEENEVDGMERKPALRVTDFVENEAELSESEWDSADEDEQGLDELDIELGDDEKFDEQKLRSGIERVQLRQMLDEDNKDLKLLQEMLLEDGELHGTGRERQFRWKNIDNAFDLESGDKNENGEEYLDETIDSEEIWRKKRHERVEFLLSNKASQEKENDHILSSNSIIKLGQKAIVRNVSSTLNSQNITAESELQTTKTSLTIKQPFSLLNKRGSFLTRGEKVLAKVAEFTKTNEKLFAKGPTRFSRNFLFSTVLNDADEENTKKRKADDGTPAAIKKLRLTNLSPATKRFTGKNSSKKLFSNG